MNASESCLRRSTPSRRSFLAGTTGAAFAAAQLRAQGPALDPNQPIGVGKGIYPGRVVWTREAKAAAWRGSGEGHWWEESQTNETLVDNMTSGAVRQLTGESTDTGAWDALFRHFNRTHGNGDVSYAKGEKVVVKVNFVGCIFSGRAVDPQTYDLVRHPDYMNTSPQMISAVLRRLVAAGVDQQDISVGDTLALFPAPYHEICKREFPDVQYLDREGGNDKQPRTRVVASAVPFYWSSRPADAAQDFVPAAYADAKYMINLANMKSHSMAGVTVCAKNHFGSLIRTPPQRGYFNIHNSLPRIMPGYGHYRALVDLMGHAHLGGKTMLYLVDALYPGVHPIEASPRKWTSAPFDGNWASSLLASQDPVAIDSVAFDFLWDAWSDYPHMPGADDYLREAALADNPPSGTFYDPDHATNTTRLASLGVHEHWNNATERKYSRNLVRNEGIELIAAV